MLGSSGFDAAVCRHLYVNWSTFVLVGLISVLFVSLGCLISCSLTYLMRSEGRSVLPFTGMASVVKYDVVSKAAEAESFSTGAALQLGAFQSPL